MVKNMGPKQFSTSGYKFATQHVVLLSFPHNLRSKCSPLLGPSPTVTGAVHKCRNLSPWTFQKMVTRLPKCSLNLAVAIHPRSQNIFECCGYFESIRQGKPLQRVGGRSTYQSLGNLASSLLPDNTG